MERSGIRSGPATTKSDDDDPVFYNGGSKANATKTMKMKVASNIIPHIIHTIYSTRTIGLVRDWCVMFWN